MLTAAAPMGGVPVRPDDTIDTLWERIKADVERELYAATLLGIMQGPSHHRSHQPVGTTARRLPPIQLVGRYGE